MDARDHQHTHHIRLWVSTHDNGCEAWVAQHDDGTFTAWACRATEDAVANYIEDSFRHACAAALFDLGRLKPSRDLRPELHWMAGARASFVG
jgi:hypothetical protein